MLHNPDGTYHQNGDAHRSDLTANRSEPWWFNINNASISTVISNEDHINLFPEHIPAEVNASRTEEHQRLKINENHVSMELIAHSDPCSSDPYTDPGYGGAWQSYATQSLGQSHLKSMLPAQMAEAPVYVNAKQYHGILRRRQSRAKAELEKKPNKVKRPYLHESRHLHAMKRERGCGGRFLSKNIAETTSHNKASPNGTSYFDEGEEVKEFPMMIRDLSF